MKKRIVMLIVAIVIIIAIVSGISIHRNRIENQFMINDDKEGISAELVKEVPGIRYADNITYRKGYKLLEKNGFYYVYISDGPKDSAADKIEVKQIIIKDKTVTVRVQTDYSGKSDGKEQGCVDCGVRLNKKPDKVIVKDYADQEYSELQVLNLVDKVYWNLFRDEEITGSVVKIVMADLIEDIKQNDLSNIMVIYNGLSAKTPTGIEKLRAKIMIGNKYKAKVALEGSDETITFEAID